MKNNSGIANILLVLLLITLIIGASYSYTQFTQKSQSEQQQLTDIAEKNLNNRASIEYKGEIAYVAAGAEDPRLPREVRAIPLDNKNIDWSMGNVSFRVTEAYFVPYFWPGGGPDLQAVTKDYFVVLKVEVRNNDIKLGTNKFDCSSFFRWRQSSDKLVDISPETVGTCGSVQIKPQANHIFYVAFKVGKENTNGTYLIGDLTTPRVIQLDFMSDETQVKQGLVLGKNGFVEDFPGFDNYYNY